MRLEETSRVGTLVKKEYELPHGSLAFPLSFGIGGRDRFFVHDYSFELFMRLVLDLQSISSKV